ncbi:hypothetical protein Bca101_061109 [Brassica carinata]
MLFLCCIRCRQRRKLCFYCRFKKYDLPELPSPVHDPELFTPEQTQAFKKIGFKNKNYVPVGVRGVLEEWSRICTCTGSLTSCDNFPKEKIKEMATMIST